MNKTIAIVLSVVLLCCSVLASCQTTTADIETTVGEGDTLNLSGIDPWTLDPALSSELTSHSYVMQIFSGLARLDDNMEVVPDIAESWQISNDGQTYTFSLRQDVKFHDGRQVTAQDFKYSWERACNPDTLSQTAATYLGDIVGVSAVLSGETDEISGVRVIDDYTLEVTIDSAKSFFLAKMAYPTTFVVDKSNVQSGPLWWQQPNGTGPFRLGEWSPHNSLVLERNELYYGESAKVDFVVFQLWGGVSINLYETGEIDVANVSVEYIDKVTDEAGIFYPDLVETPELSFYYFGFNCSKPPFDDANIRRAFSHAVDKDKMIALIYRGLVERANGILPEGIPGYNPDLVGLDYDIDLARELIAQSKYGDAPNLPPITVTTLGWGGVISDDLEAIVYDWEQNLGVDITVRQIEPERFYYHLREEKDEMYFTGWVADYPHPQDFLEILFHSDSENNHSDYSNPEVDTLLEMAGREQDMETSLALYQQAEQLLVEDAACLPLWFGRNYELVKPYVKGYHLNPLGIPMLYQVSIEDK